MKSIHKYLSGFKSMNEYATFLLMEAYYANRQFSFTPHYQIISNDFGNNAEDFKESDLQEYYATLEKRDDFFCLICGQHLYSHGYGVVDYGSSKYFDDIKKCITAQEADTNLGFEYLSPKLECTDSQCKVVRKYFAFPCNDFSIIDTDNYGYNLTITHRKAPFNRRLQQARKNAHIQNKNIVEDGLTEKQYEALLQLIEKDMP